MSARPKPGYEQTEEGAIIPECGWDKLPAIQIS